MTLTFDAAVLSTGNGATVLAVTGPSGKHYETGCPVVRNDDLSAAVRLGPAGTYTATWRIVSSDGHPVSDSIRFRYAPAAVRWRPRIRDRPVVRIRRHARRVAGRILVVLLRDRGADRGGRGGPGRAGPRRRRGRRGGHPPAALIARPHHGGGPCLHRPCRRMGG